MTMAFAPSPGLNHHGPAREEIVANVLHVLSSYTESSPLLCRYGWVKVDEEGSGAVVSWDPFVSFSESMPLTYSATATHSSFFRDWTAQFLRTLRTGGNDREEMARLMSAFANGSRMDELVNDGDAKVNDDLFWQAGLDLLEKHLYLHQESDEDGDDHASGSEKILDPIPPHDLLRTVMDSYYFANKELATGDFFRAGAGLSSERTYRVPSALATLFLRSFLVSLALEGAGGSIPGPGSGSSGPVRWRRLASVAGDALSLFGRMTFDHAGKSMQDFEPGRLPRSTGPHPVEPDHVVSIATWLYAHHVFPSCRGLLSRLLRNIEENADNDKGPSSGIKTLETCYDSLRMLTSLSALEVLAAEKEYTSPSRSFQRVLKCIESRSTSDLFDRVKSAQAKVTREVGRRRHSVWAKGEDAMHRPSNDGGPGPVLNGGGLSLEENFLLYPSIRKYETSDESSSATFYDETGLALIAYWKLWAETDATADSSSLTLEPLPYPYCGWYRWTLLFPHILTFLHASRASSTVRRMDELDLLSGSDDYLASIDFTTVSLGLDMLHKLISQTPATRPMKSPSFMKRQNPVARWSHSVQCLHSTMMVLLSHFARISSLEVLRENEPPPEVCHTLKYSSSEVMRMTETLLRFYRPVTQVACLSSLCREIKTNQHGALLPRVIDMMRPLIMGMCGNIRRYSDSAVALEDMAVMEKTSEVVDLLVADYHDNFCDPNSPSPNDVEGFMSYGEAYSSVFSIVRLQQIWISRCKAAEGQLAGSWDASKLFRGIAKRMDRRLGELKSFDLSLSRFIDFLQSSNDRPDNWYRLFLVKLALEDALKQPDE